MPAPSNTTGTLPDVVKTVFNRMALFAYRAKNVFRATADLKWAEGDGPMPGDRVTFTLINALAAATAPLAEDTEPTPVAIGDTQKTVILVEQGNATKTTKKLKLTSFINLDLVIPREVAANMEESIDLVARNVLVAGTNVKRPGDKAKASLTASDNLSASLVRFIRAKLSGFNTPYPPGFGEYFKAVGHPDILHDLQAETGQAAWSTPLVYGGQVGGNILTGEIGAFGGMRWMENANSKIDADSGSGGTVDVYHTVFSGEQALGEGVAESQHIVTAGPFDDLQRFVSVGWYALIGYGRIRENSLYRIEAASSIGANT